MISLSVLRDAIRALNLPGTCVCLHASMRSFGEPVEGGADGVLQAFLESGCTVMMPAFSDMYEVQPVPPYMPPRNGAGDYAGFLLRTYTPPEPYTPSSNRISTEEMGILAQRLLNQPGRVRGSNPLNSFAAWGPQAHQLIDGQSPRFVYAPFEALCRLDGYVLLMGVSLESATILHYAEQKAGRTPFVRWAQNPEGRTIPVSVGSCSLGFDRLLPAVQDAVRQIPVAQSLWTCCKAQDIVRLCANALLRDPALSHCGNPACERCNDAVQGGPLLGDDFWN